MANEYFNETVGFVPRLPLISSISNCNTDRRFYTFQEGLEKGIQKECFGTKFIAMADDEDQQMAL